MSSDRINRMLVDSVHLEFGKLTVLQSAFVTSERGKVTGVLGRNGTGKSCLFKCIMGGIKSQNIFVRFNDEQSTDYGHIGDRVKYLPQNLFMPPRMTLDEAFRLYDVEYDGLVSFDPKFHTSQKKQFREYPVARLVSLKCSSSSSHPLISESWTNLSPTSPLFMSRRCSR